MGDYVDNTVLIRLPLIYREEFRNKSSHINFVVEGFSGWGWEVDGVPPEMTSMYIRIWKNSISMEEIEKHLEDFQGAKILYDHPIG